MWCVRGMLAAAERASLTCVRCSARARAVWVKLGGEGAARAAPRRHFCFPSRTFERLCNFMISPLQIVAAAIILYRLGRSLITSRFVLFHFVLILPPEVEDTESCSSPRGVFGCVWPRRSELRINREELPPREAPGLRLLQLRGDQEEEEQRLSSAFRDARVKVSPRFRIESVRTTGDFHGVFKRVPLGWTW